METKITKIFKPEKGEAVSTKMTDDKRDTTACVGFPSPAANYMKKGLDLNEFFIKHPSATFYLRVTGDSMSRAGIQSEDILIVDRAIKPTDDRVVIVILDGEFMVRRLRLTKNKIRLIPDNDNYQPIEIREETDFQIWGVVTGVIHVL